MVIIPKTFSLHALNLRSVLSACLPLCASCLPFLYGTSFDSRFASADILLLSSVQAITATVGFSPSFRSGSRYTLVDLYPKQYTCMWLRSTTGFFDNFFTNSLNEPFLTSCIFLTVSIGSVGLYVCILFKVIRPHFDVFRSNSDRFPREY